MALGFYRLVAALGRGDMVVASTFGSFALLAILVLGGFILSKGENLEGSHLYTKFLFRLFLVLI